MRYSTKLTFSIALTTVLLAAMTSGALYFLTKRIVAENVERELRSATLQTSLTLDRLLFERMADMKIVASEPLISADSMDQPQISRRLQEFRNSYLSYLTISLFDSEIRIADASSLGLGEHSGDDPFWNTLTSIQEPVVSSEPEIVFGKSVIRIGAPVKGPRDRYVVGYLSLGFLGKVVSDSVETISEDTDFFLVDMNGELLFSTNNESTLWDKSRTDLLQFMVSQGKTGFGSVAGDEGNSLFAFSKSPGYLDYGGNDWFLLGVKPENKAFAPLQRLQAQVAAIWFVGILLTIVGIGLISRRMIRPVQHLTTAATRIAEGDLDVRVVSKRRDEIGTLAVSFEAMKTAQAKMAGMAESIAAGNLSAEISVRGEHDRLGNALSRMQKNLSRQIGEISRSASKLQATGVHLSSFSSQLAVSASESAAAVSQTTASVEEVKQIASLSHRKAQEVSRAAQDTVEVSKTGTESVQRSLEFMKRIQVQMSEIGRKIADLGEQSRIIGDIIMSVGELSDQSNILAVNAAIEASRAGESGIGFTVIAGEIRTLAEQSKQATLKVRELLGEIQNLTQSATRSMENGSELMDEGLSYSSESGEAIKSLTDQIEHAADAAAQIAASSRQQLAGMDQIATAMESIKDATIQNEDNTRMMEQEAKGLTELGRQLDEAVGFYANRGTDS